MKIRDEELEGRFGDGGLWIVEMEIRRWDSGKGAVSTWLPCVVWLLFPCQCTLYHINLLLVFLEERHVDRGLGLMLGDGVSRV